MRAALVVLFVAALVPSAARAQVDTERPPPVVTESSPPTPASVTLPPTGPAEWPSAPLHMPTATNPRFEHTPDVGTIVLGAVIGGVGWIGSIIVGAIALGGGELTGRTCDENVGISLVPIVGVPLGLGLAYGCPNIASTGPLTGGVSVGGLLVVGDVVSEVAQLAGLFLGLMGGLVGERVLVTDAAALSLSPLASPSLAGMSLSLDF